MTDAGKFDDYAGLARFVAISVALHIGIGLAASVDWAVPEPRKRLVEVELAPPAGKPGAPEPVAEPASPPPVAAPEPPPPAPAPEPVAKPQPKPEPAPQPKPAPKPEAAPKPAPKPEPQPVAKPEPEPAAPPSPAAAPGETLSDIRKMLADKKAADGQGGAGGDAHNLPSGVKGRLYFSQLQAAIRAVWSVPPGSRQSPVEIEVLIGSNGTLIRRTMVKSSGDTLLDRSALAALDAADLPAPPEDFDTPLQMIMRLIPPEE